MVKIMIRFVKLCSVVLYLYSAVCFSQSNDLEQNIIQLKAQSEQLQKKINALETQLNSSTKNTKLVMLKSDTILSPDSVIPPPDDNKNRLKRLHRPLVAGTTHPRHPKFKPDPSAHEAQVVVHSMDLDPESVDFYPTALVADGRVLTYIAGTPVVSSPYLGSRPAFDGSDYLVNISSINRDIRLMQQRRNLYRAYEKVGYSAPNMPIIMLSGKAEPMGYIGREYNKNYVADWTFASSELDVAAFLNDKVEAYMGIAYNQAPPPGGGQRVANSAFGLNMGFINIGDLDETPYYMTAGQLYAPFARYSTGMVSAPLTMVFSRTRTRPLIIGYKSQADSGPFAAAYAFRTDTTLGNQAAGGLNWGYILNARDFTGEFGISYITSVDDASGMQYTGPSQPNTFSGFAAAENVGKTPAGGAHVTLSFDCYNLTAEWITNLNAFRAQDLSFNGNGVMGSAGQIEAGMTFMAFNRPSGLSLGYQWTNQLLALNLPRHRIIGTYNISIWKDTVESIEYRHEIDYGLNNFANGASASGVVYNNTVGTGKSYDMISLQIGVYF